MRWLSVDKQAVKHRQSLILCLRSFPQSDSHSDGHPPPPLQLHGTDERNSEEGNDDDYQTYVQTLYSSLSTDGLCIYEDGQKYMTLNLHLNSCTCSESDDGVKFRVLFLDHPHGRETETACHWQDTQILVRRKRLVQPFLSAYFFLFDTTG